MRRVIIGGLVIVASSVGAVQAHAQAGIGVNIGGGPTVPIGDDKGVGFHVNAGVGLAPAVLPFGLRLEGMFQRLPEGDVDHEYLGGSLNAEFGIPMAASPIRPYVIGGLGLVRHEEHHGDHSHGSHTDFGVNLGAGTQFSLGRLSAYVEARVHRLVGGEDDHGHGHDDHTGNTFIPVTFGIRF